MNESILPADFDGVFRFTNSSDQDFSARWGGIEYTFPALKTVPMIIPGATPEEVQHIRKKFAKEWALREFQKTDKFATLNKHVEGGVPAGYTESDLVDFTQKCLEPLPLAQAAMKKLAKDSEANYKKDSKGRNVSRVLDENESLMDSGSGAI